MVAPRLRKDDERPPDIKPRTCGRSREAGVRAAAKRDCFFGTRPPAQEYAPNGRYALGKRTRKLASGASEMGQELTSTGVPTGIERQKRLVRYCRGYLRPSACVVPLNWP